MDKLNEEDKALRFDGSKIRLDLVSPTATKELARVLTFGANKYEAHNWTKGMRWSRVLASLERHLNAIKAGIDYDEETGCLHSAHVMCNAMFLTDYYKIYPQGDDRLHKYLKPLRYGIDIDGVLADFSGHLIANFQIYHTPFHWNDPVIKDLYEKVKDDENFWLGIPPLVSQEDMPFEPACYVTSRSVPTEVTEKWLDKHGFPRAKVISVGHEESKVEAVKEANIDIFIDDKWENFVELNNAGICCFLYDQPYNRKHNVGFKRIKNLKEIFNDI
jgi:uncharacterized HAD superfamily protein